MVDQITLTVKFRVSLPHTCISQVVAIVMDLLTDLQILQDLLDAASRRSVAVYIILDSKGAPHFLDMCGRLEVGPHQLQVSRTHKEEHVSIRNADTYS